MDGCSPAVAEEVCATMAPEDFADLAHLLHIKIMVDHVSWPNPYAIEAMGIEMRSIELASDAVSQEMGGVEGDESDEAGF